MHRRSQRGAVEGGVFAFGLLLLVVGGGLLAFGWSEAAKAKASTTWPTTPGIIMSSSVEVVPDSEGEDGHKPTVVYAYSVDGRPFQATLINFGSHNGADLDAVERTVARYPPGEVVDVAYDPADPGTAVLEPGNTGANWVMQLAGAACVLGGLAMMAGSVYFPTRTVKRRRNSNPLTPMSPSQQPPPPWNFDPSSTNSPPYPFTR
ncbi:MAG: DUF3592 domain-containing protein [Microthrixaceae bacterium]|nr:DUF3592 domain-containing protein [Microthrixaceae bacterium]